MGDFTTVFEVTTRIDPEALALTIAGLVGIIVGVVALILRKRRGGWPLSFGGPLFMVILASILLVAGLILLVGSITGTRRLTSAYMRGQYQIVEGVVHVVHRQRAAGHDEGDIVSINGQEFEVDYYDSTPGYNTTIAHGGVLKEGRYARVYHLGGRIIRIDIRSSDEE